MTEQERREASIACRYCARCNRYEGSDNTYFCRLEKNRGVDGTLATVTLDYKCSQFWPREKVTPKQYDYDSAFDVLAWSFSQEGTPRKRKDGSYMLELKSVPELEKRLIEQERKKEIEERRERAEEQYQKWAWAIPVILIVSFLILLSMSGQG